MNGSLMALLKDQILQNSNTLTSGESIYDGCTEFSFEFTT